jgi:hypothetical protein
MMDVADKLFIGSYVSDKKQRPEERAEEPVYCCRSIAFVSLVKKPLLAL